MRRRTLVLLAIPATIAAMIVAVPALAGIPILTGAHTATSTKCFNARVAKHRVRECLIRGPRGLRGIPGPAGPRGFTGKNGTNGENGTNGKTGAPGKTGATGATGATGGTGATGPAGPAGTARGYAVVQPTTPNTATLVTPHNITGVTEPAAGVYCVAPAAPIDAAEETVAVSPEVSYSSGKLPGVVAVNAQRTGGCPATTFEIDTYAPSGTAPTSDYAFTIVVP